MSISIKKLGILAVMATLLVVLAALRPTAQTPVAQADLGSPGGIAALPSAAPAVPGLANQGLPAIIGTGQMAIVAVFCARRRTLRDIETCPTWQGIVRGEVVDTDYWAPLPWS